MNEIEKLRALLAEAHDRLRKARYLTPVTMSEQIGDLVGRIDAALAEPVEPVEEVEHHWADYSGVQACWTCGMVKRADGSNKPCRGKTTIGLRTACADCENSFRLAGTRERERDEARAEVRKLRDILCHKRAEVEGAAYRRGAEAMREAAAKEMLRLRNRYNERINTMQIIGAEVPDHLGIAREEAGCHMDIIRALPLPEDKQ